MALFPRTSRDGDAALQGHFEIQLRSEQSSPPRQWDREMLSGGRRGHGNFVAASNRWSAAMPQPNDLSRSLVALDQNSTIIAVVEMSQSSWLVGGVLPGIERRSDATERRDAGGLDLADNRQDVTGELIGSRAVCRVRLYGGLRIAELRPGRFEPIALPHTWGDVACFPAPAGMNRQNLGHRALDNLVFTRRNAEGPAAAGAFRDIRAAYRLGQYCPLNSAL